MRLSRIRNGVVTVEMALLAPILLFLLLGALELGVLVANVVILHAGARSAARMASTGAPTTVITAEVQRVAKVIGQGGPTIALDYRVRNDDGTWSDWLPLTDVQQDDVTVNSAPSGAQLRITLTYTHHILIPGLFGFLADPPGGSSRTLQAVGVVRRE